MFMAAAALGITMAEGVATATGCGASEAAVGVLLGEQLVNNISIEKRMKILFLLFIVS